jgi:hypothetical protein
LSLPQGNADKDQQTYSDLPKNIAIAATFRNNRAMRICRLSLLALLLIVPMALQNPTALAQTAPAAPPTNTSDILLHPADLDTLIPPAVYFQGQSATVQKRNSGGVHFAGGPYMFAVKVDTGGYSSSIQERYQTYLITETALDIDGHKLPAGAYGVGFIANNKFLVMDLGGHDIFTAASQHDEAMSRPTPLQVQADPTHGYRLYSGRDFIVFNRSAK